MPITEVDTPPMLFAEGYGHGELDTIRLIAEWLDVYGHHEMARSIERGDWKKREL